MKDFFYRKSDFRDEENQLRASNDRSLMELQDKLLSELESKKLELLEVGAKRRLRFLVW